MTIHMILCLGVTVPHHTVGKMPSLHEAILIQKMELIHFQL